MMIVRYQSCRNYEPILTNKQKTSWKKCINKKHPVKPSSRSMFCSTKFLVSLVGPRTPDAHAAGRSRQLLNIGNYPPSSTNSKALLGSIWMTPWKGRPRWHIQVDAPQHSHLQTKWLQVCARKFPWDWEIWILFVFLLRGNLLLA